MKGDYYCSTCAAPNPRHEHALENLRAAVLEVAGIEEQDADGDSANFVWDVFQRKMWPPTSEA
jgi:hypothetical protein